MLIAATIGVISPSGNEVGPFLSAEQAAMSQIVPDRKRTHVFAWYNLVGSFATMFGALCGGLAQLLQNIGMTPLNSFRAMVIGYGLIGLLLLVIFSRPTYILLASKVTPLTIGQHGHQGDSLLPPTLIQMEVGREWANLAKGRRFYDARPDQALQLLLAHSRRTL